LSLIKSIKTIVVLIYFLHNEKHRRERKPSQNTGYRHTTTGKNIMSKLQISELNSTSLTVLNDQETSAVVGGYWFGNRISRSYNTQVGVNLSSINQGAGGGYYGGGYNSAYVSQRVYNSIG
jgi:hypothetical protein